MKRPFLVLSGLFFLVCVLACGGGSPETKQKTTVEIPEVGSHETKQKTTPEIYWEEQQSVISEGEVLKVQRGMFKGDVLEGIGTKYSGDDKPYYLFADLKSVHEFQDSYFKKNPGTRKTLIDAGKAFPLAEGSSVKLLKKNIDLAYVKVEVLDGPYAKKEGLVELYGVVPKERIKKTTKSEKTGQTEEPKQVPVAERPEWLKKLKRLQVEHDEKCKIEIAAAQAKFDESKKNLDRHPRDVYFQRDFNRASTDLATAKKNMDSDAWVPVLNPETMKTGDVGMLCPMVFNQRAAYTFSVIQIVDRNTLLASHKDEVLWIEGLNTSDLADGKKFNILPPLIGECIGTKTYTSVLGGKKTVMAMSVHDINKEPIRIESK